MMDKSYVICLNNAGYEASLELRKLYEVLEDSVAAEHGQLRVIDESGDDYLYPSKMFANIDLPSAIRAQLQSAA